MVNYSVKPLSVPSGSGAPHVKKLQKGGTHRNQQAVEQKGAGANPIEKDPFELQHPFLGAIDL